MILCGRAGDDDVDHGTAWSAIRLRPVSIPDLTPI